MTGAVRGRLRVAGVMAALAFVSLLRRLGGTRVVRALGGEPRAAGPGDGGALTGPIAPATRSVAGAVGAAARRLPPTSCLDRALTGAWLLHRRGRPGRVILGVPADPASAVTHAWLVDGNGRACIGAREAAAYLPVTVFDRRPAGAEGGGPR